MSSGSPNLLNVSGLAKSFGDNQVFSDVSFQVPRGTVTAIIGPSGSGKSTILRCINQLERADEGTIEIDGYTYSTGPGKLNRTESQRLHRTVGMVFQQFNLFPHLNVLRNITLPLEKTLKLDRQTAEERARRFLAQVNLAEKAQAYPAELSGGQQQRVAIARSLALEPQLMLFDEPTSSLDPELGYEVLLTIQELARSGATMVIVTHEMAFAENVADQVLVVADGQIIERGSASAVFSRTSHPRTKQFLQHVRRG